MITEVLLAHQFVDHCDGFGWRCVGSADCDAEGDTWPQYVEHIAEVMAT